MRYADTLLEMMGAAYSTSAPPRFPIAASSIGDCPRKHSMLLNGAERGELSPKSARVLEDGTVRGVALANRLARHAFKQGMDCRLEHEIWTEIACERPKEIVAKARAWMEDFGEVSPDRLDAECPIRVCPTSRAIEVRGRSDVLLFESAKRVHLIDFKGKASYGMKMLPEEGPGFGYLGQAWMYALGLPRQGLSVASCTVFFENKDSQDWYPCDVDVSGKPPPEIVRLLLEIGQILDAWAGDRFTGLEGTPIYALEALAELRSKGKAALPWPCQYCSVGPITGKCVGTATITDNRKPGTHIPKWQLT